MILLIYKRFYLLLLSLVVISCGILEPREVIGIPKTADFAKDGFTCQVYGVQYAYSERDARKDKWRLKFGATVVNDSGSTNVSILVEFVILDKVDRDEIEFVSIYLGRSWDINEVREGTIVNEAVLDLSEVVWSARLVIIE